MKKSLLFISLLIATASLQAQINETANDAVKNMGVGWNLGNTLDANQGKGLPSQDSYWNVQGLESETCWGQPTTRAELIKMMKNAGFGAIRVPVTWYNHMDKEGNVDKDWMKRVHEVVDYVIGEGLYCIVNVHHDTGCGEGDANGITFSHWIQANEESYNANKERFEKLWTQIANEFKDYGEKLVFAGYNEMLDNVKYKDGGKYKEGSWCYASFSTSGRYDAAVAESAYKGINGYAQSFVNAVRATGGNNATRNLVVPTYAAACGTGNWQPHLQDPLKMMALPNDEVKDHIIFEVHTYPNIANGFKSEVDDLVNQLTTHLMSKGAPVIVGEWGTSNVDNAGATDYDVNRDKMFQFVDYFIEQTKSRNIATFFWMGLSDGMYRTAPAFNQGDLAERITKAYHGSNFKGEYPEFKITGESVLFEGDKELVWGNCFEIPKDYFNSIGSGVQLEISYKLDYTDYDDIQFNYADWSGKFAGNVDNKTVAIDFSPSKHYGIKSGDEKSTIFTFSSDVFNNLCRKGMIIQGHGLRVRKMVISDSSAASIEDISSETSFDGPFYNLSGQRVSTVESGRIYISNGRKVLIR